MGHRIIGKHSKLSLILLLLSGTVATTTAYSQTWKYVSPMHHARTSHCALLLNSGEIMAIGGQDGNQVLTSCEIYSPLTDKWREVASLNIPRYEFQSFLLPDGKILATGGLTDLALSTTATCEIYDPAIDTWTMTATMSDRRAGQQGAQMPGGKVLLIGGIDATPHTYLTSCDIYDETTKTITPVAPLLIPSATSDAVYLPYNNTVLLPGGYFGGKYGFQFKSTQIYSIAKNQWTLGDSLLESQGNNFNVVLDPVTNNTFVIGGDLNTEATLLTGDAEYLDPLTLHWNKGGAIGPAVAHFVSLANRDSLISTGGLDANAQILNSTWWYSIRTNTGSPGPNLLEPLYGHYQIVQSQIDPEDPCRQIGCVFVLGGTNSSGATTHCERLDIGSSLLPAEISLMPSSINSGGVASCDSMNVSLTLNVKSCSSVGLDSAFISGSSEPVKILEGLPLILNRAGSTSVTLRLSRDERRARYLTFVISASDGRRAIEIPIISTTNDLSQLAIPKDVHFFGSPCDRFDTTILLRNFGCGPILVDSLYITGSNSPYYNASIDNISIRPGDSSFLHIFYSSTTSSGSDNLLHVRYHELGVERDSSIPISATVSRLNPTIIQTIMKDAKHSHSGDTITIPIYVLTKQPIGMRGCRIALEYNTDLLEQIDPAFSNTLLQGISLFDIKESSHTARLTFPYPFICNSTLPLVKLRFLSFLSDSSQTEVHMKSIALDEVSPSSTECLSILQDSAAVVFDPGCGDASLRSAMRNNSPSILSTTVLGNTVIAHVSRMAFPGLIEVYNYLGVLIANKSLAVLASPQKCEIHCRALTSGLYLVVLKGVGRISTAKILVDR